MNDLIELGAALAGVLIFFAAAGVIGWLISEAIERLGAGE